MNRAILKLLARITGRNAGAARGLFSAANPALRIPAALICVLLVALSRNAVFVVAVLAVQLLRLALLPASSLPGLLRRLLLPVLLTLVLLLPAVFLGHPRTLLTVTLKVAASVLTLLLLYEELGWEGLSAGLQTLRVPPLFVMTLDTTLRFLVLLGRRAAAMLEALSLRLFEAPRAKRKPSADGRPSSTLRTQRARDRRRIQAAGGVLGTTFLASQKLAAETWQAMECRSFRGVYKHFGKRRVGAADILYLLLPAALIAFFVWSQRAMGRM